MGSDDESAKAKDIMQSSYHDALHATPSAAGAELASENSTCRSRRRSGGGVRRRRTMIAKFIEPANQTTNPAPRWALPMMKPQLAVYYRNARSRTRSAIRRRCGR